MPDPHGRGRNPTFRTYVSMGKRTTFKGPGMTMERGLKENVIGEAERQAHDTAVEAGGFGKQKSFKKGGRVKKTGTYKLHKGEHVVPRTRVRELAANLNM